MAHDFAIILVMMLMMPPPHQCKLTQLQVVEKIMNTLSFFWVNSEGLNGSSTKDSLDGSTSDSFGLVCRAV